MSLILHLERSSSQALYLQIAEQIKVQICDGRLPATAQLPTVRQLARQLQVTRLTIQNAYGELQSEGWVEATIGRGTFVSAAVRPQTIPPSITTLGDQRPTPDSVINDMIQLQQLETEPMAGMRSMAVGAPDPKLFPTEEFWGAILSLQSDWTSLVGYGSPQGDPMLRVEIASMLKQRHIHATPDEIIVTAGTTHALSMVVQALAQAGDVVLVEQPTYLGFLHILKEQRIQPVGIALDQEGPQLDALERAIQLHRPRFFYTSPTYQNPTGICATMERRKAVLELAERYGILIVEDDIYARLAYDTPPPLPLRSLDTNDSVVYVSSESKVLMPSLRVGYIVAPNALQGRLLSIRRATDLCSPTFLQRALATFLQDKGLQRHLKRTIPIYRRRRDALLFALRRYMPEEITWTEPAGGFCCWLTLPRTHALRDVHRAALEHRLALAPGEVFLVHPSRELHLRLTFSSQNEEGIRAGIELLGELISERLAKGNAEADKIYDWTPLV
ncbi:MAG: PLP-dependent aminotransferase family protein [Chloroflexota bacterium]